MKILFYCRGDESLAIESLAAVLEQAGHSVDLLFDSGIEDTFYYQVKGLEVFKNKNRLREKAREFSPHLLAVSSVTNDYPYVMKEVSKLKKSLKVPVIVGGVHATAAPEFVINHPDVDMVCRGEGEGALLDLVNSMAAGRDDYDIKNIWFKKKGGVIKKNDLRPLISDLDSLPFPNKDLFYQYGCFKNVLVERSGRGCPFNCTECHNCLEHKLYSGQQVYRRRSVEYLISLLSYYKRKYNLKKIDFEEDIFVFDKDWLRKFSYYYKKEISLPFYCFAHPNLLDEERIKILKQTGCKEVFVGVESGNNLLREKIIRRDTPDDKIKKNIGLLKKNKIKVLVSAIFGWPGETPENMWETVKLCDELSPYFLETFTLYPYPGTDILRYCRDKNLIDKDGLLHIYKGESSDAGTIVFDHPYKDLAYVMAKLAPVYTKVPYFLKPLVKKIMHSSMKNFVNPIYLFFLCVRYPAKVFAKLNKLVIMTAKCNKKYFSNSIKC
jgi:radical SAM superfamily enzyme YgiQ (UPF0313 family)